MRPTQTRGCLTMSAMGWKNWKNDSFYLLSLCTRPLLLCLMSWRLTHTPFFQQLLLLPLAAEVPACWVQLLELVPQWYVAPSTQWGQRALWNSRDLCKTNLRPEGKDKCVVHVAKLNVMQYMPQSLKQSYSTCNTPYLQLGQCRQQPWSTFQCSIWCVIVQVQVLQQRKVLQCKTYTSWRQIT